MVSPIEKTSFHWDWENDSNFTDGFSDMEMTEESYDETSDNDISNDSENEWKIFEVCDLPLPVIVYCNT